MGFPETDEREKVAESLFKEIEAQNFPNLGKKLDMQISEANRILNYLNTKIPSLRRMIIKLSNINDKGRI